MRVLMTVTWYSEFNAESVSAGIFHYELASELNKTDEIAIFFPFDNVGSGRLLENNEWGVKTFRSGSNTQGRVKRKAILYRNYERVISTFKPDIIHAHVGEAAGYVSARIGRLHKIPVITTEHNPIQLMDLQNKRVRNHIEYAYSNSKQVVCVSEGQKRALERAFPKIGFQTIYNGVKMPEPRHLTGYAKDGINACIAANFYAKDIKGYQYLIPAIKELTDRGRNIYLHICGDGEYKEYYERLAADLGLQDRCIFYGFCDKGKLSDIVSQMDFCISASLFESAGVTVEEMMTLGKPLVVTNSGGASSLVTDKTAIIIEKGNVGSIVDGINLMMDNLSSFDSDYIRGYAYDNFSIEVEASRYRDMYCHLKEE